MSTMFDVPMQDFSGEGSMDTDMLPLSVSDADWLQVENMIEDDVSKQLVAEEVEMIQEDVQEFEMADSGDADILEYIDGTPADVIQTHSTLDVFDQEIPDASRAPSPTPIIQSIEPAAHTLELSSIPETHAEVHHIDSNVYSNEQYEETGNVHETTVAYNEHEQVELGAHDEHIPSAQLEVTVEYVSPDTVESTREYDSQQHLEHEGGPDHRENSTHAEIIPPVAALEVSAASSLPDESQHHHEEYYASSDRHEVQEEYTVSSVAEPESATVGRPEQDVHSLHETQSNSQAEEQSVYAVLSSHNVGQNEKDEEEESLVEPPPCVLLTYLFDGSQYALFLNLEENPVEIDESQSKTVEPTESETSSSNKPEPQAVESKPRPTLLFSEQPDLFYAPMSRIFRAIRDDPVVNLGGRFDENIELVLTAVGLDLRLSEDNIHAREVSLNDLSVLHTGCELTGILSLQLDTIAPRFGTRYKAIRDALVSIVSNADDPEHDQTGHVEGHEDADARQAAVEEVPAVSSAPSQTVHDGNHEKVIDIKYADTAEEAKEEVTDSRHLKVNEEGKDDEVESDHENENENENEGIGHVQHVTTTEEHADAHTEPEGVQDEYFDEDAEGEYAEEEEEEQSFEGTHDHADISSYSGNQEEENPLTFEENPQEDENDADDQNNNEPTVVEVFYPEGPIEDGLTPEQNSPASAEGSSYEASVHEDEIDNFASNDDHLPSLQTVAPLGVSSKRSFDEHEHDQYDEDGGSPSSTGEATQKRLRLD